jgi:hypothetical protein
VAGNIEAVAGGWGLGTGKNIKATSLRATIFKPGAGDWGLETGNNIKIKLALCAILFIIP